MRTIICTESGMVRCMDGTLTSELSLKGTPTGRPTSSAAALFRTTIKQDGTPLNHTAQAAITGMLVQLHHRLSKDFHHSLVTASRKSEGSEHMTEMSLSKCALHCEVGQDVSTALSPLFTVAAWDSLGIATWQCNKPEDGSAT